MEKLQTLEELRTRREVKNYFKQLGKEITDEELDALKQSYEKAQESNGALTLQQLDDVAGGGMVTFQFRGTKYFSPYCELFINEEGCLSFKSSGNRGQELTEAVPFFNAGNPEDIIMVRRSRTKFEGETTDFTSNECVYPIFDFGKPDPDGIAVDKVNDYAQNKTRISSLTADALLEHADGTYTFDPSASIWFSAPIKLSSDDLGVVLRSMEMLERDGANRGHEFYDAYKGLITIINVHNLDHCPV